MIAYMVVRAVTLLSLFILVVQTNTLFAQTIASIVSPTNETHFQKAVGMELNIPLEAQVTPSVATGTLFFYANGRVVASGRIQSGFCFTVWSNVAFGEYSLIAGTGPPAPPSDPMTIFVDPWGL